jgi:hypothetical protein
MNCTQCGSPLEPGVKFCGACGQPVPPESTVIEPADLEDMPTEIAPEPMPPAPKWYLVVEDGAWEAENLLLGEQVLIGRGGESKVKLADSEVSRHHAMIERFGDGYMIADQGSTNGTFVNDERISGSVPLKIGDKIRIGKTLFRISTDEPIEAQVCPACSAGITAEMTFCGACGHPLSAVPAPARSSAPTPVAAPAQPVPVAPIPYASESDEGEEAPPPRLKPSRRGLLIGCGVILVLGIAAACCVSTIGSGLLEWLQDLIYEIQYLF